ncbi:hypothetical protein BGZ98_004457, partial [Dissophora globulifera]
MEQSRQTDGILIDYKEPEELEQLIDFSLPDQGVGPEGIFPLISQTLQYSVNTFSPRFMDKLYAGSSPIGVLSELLLAGLNGNSHVYHVSPVFTLMEIHVTRALARLFGFKGEFAGGLSCPGGSASNQLAMATARNALFPEIKKKGYSPRLSVSELEELERRAAETGAGAEAIRAYHMFGPAATSTYGKLMVFTSAAGHYSMEKSAVVMGLGTDNVVGVPCDPYGAIIPSELERLIQEHIAMGHTPYFINVTAGTTVLGAFDPIRPCSEIAKRYNCWLHVDGSWGGSTVFVPELAKTLLDGSELADSITLNPHKMLQTPLQCSLLIVQDTTVFPRANGLKANYLFHGQSHDLGDGTLGCGRRSDAVKLFLGWRYYGAHGYRLRIEKALSNVDRFIDLLAMDGFRDGRIQMLRLGPVETENQQQQKDKSSKPSLLQVCFWYRPQGSRLVDWHGTERVWKEGVESPSLSTRTKQDLVEEENNTLHVPSSGKLSRSPSTVSVASSASTRSTVSTSSSTATTTTAVAATASINYGHGVVLTDAQDREQAKAWMESV